MRKKLTYLFLCSIFILILIAGCTEPRSTETASLTYALTSTIDIQPTPTEPKPVTSTSVPPPTPPITKSGPKAIDLADIQITTSFYSGGANPANEGLDVKVLGYNSKNQNIGLTPFPLDVLLYESPKKVISKTFSMSDSVRIPFDDFVPFDDVSDPYRMFNGFIEAVMNVSDNASIKAQDSLQIYLKGEEPITLKDYRDHLEAKYLVANPPRVYTGDPVVIANIFMPSKGSTGVSLLPVISWYDPIGATGYDIYLATDSNFTQIVDSKTNIPTIYFIPAFPLKADTTYFWKVRALSSTHNTASSWVTNSFSTKD